MNFSGKIIYSQKFNFCFQYFCMLFFYELESKQTHFLRVHEVYEIHIVFYQNRMTNTFMWLNQTCELNKRFSFNSTKDMNMCFGSFWEIKDAWLSSTPNQYIHEVFFKINELPFRLIFKACSIMSVNVRCNHNFNYYKYHALSYMFIVFMRQLIICKRRFKWNRS